MKRLTKRDWEILGTAMGAYLSEDWQGVHGWSDEEAVAHYNEARATAEKVWARVPEGGK